MNNFISIRSPSLIFYIISSVVDLPKQYHMNARNDLLVLHSTHKKPFLEIEKIVFLKEREIQGQQKTETYF